MFQPSSPRPQLGIARIEGQRLAVGLRFDQETLLDHRVEQIERVLLERLQRLLGNRCVALVDGDVTMPVSFSIALFVPDSRKVSISAGVQTLSRVVCETLRSVDWMRSESPTTVIFTVADVPTSSGCKSPGRA